MNIRQNISISLLGCLYVLSSMAATNTSQSIMNLKVTRDGIYRVTAADLSSLGVDLLGIQISNISIMHNSTIVPVKVTSNDQVVFDGNSTIEFIGESAETLYQSGSIYRIILSKNHSIKASSISPQDNLVTENSYVQVDTFADNNAYNFGSPISDPWYSHKIQAVGSEKVLALNFNIDNIVQDGDVSVELNVWGGIDFAQSPDHHVKYQLNGTKVADFKFDGFKLRKHKFVEPGIKYVDGQQELKILVPNDTNTPADIINVESMVVKYPRAYVLNNKQMDFLLDENILTSLGDPIFSSGFDSDQVANGGTVVKAIAVNNNNYRIKNANNENYIVYALQRNGQIESVNYIQANSCIQSTSMNCDLQFSVKSDSIRVYITAESTILKPELSVPVMQENINSGTAELLIITHPDFIGTEMDAFVASKQSEFSVKVVNVDQIYAQYGYGNVSAESIADYIKYAAQKLGVKNVLLVGGDTYDYKNYLGSGSISFIPTLYTRTDKFVSFAPVDAKFADIDGDNVPDINIGRFPVRTEAEFANLRLKLENYNNKNYSETIVFAADKFDLSNNYSFKDDAETLINVLPARWKDNITIDNKAYIDDDGVSLSRSKIVAKINQGVALTSFIGHSAPIAWNSGSEILFSSTDATNLLSNLTTPTVVTQWGCWNTYFVSPNENTMAHAFLLNQFGGAASVLGASTLTEAEHEKGLAKLVLRFLTVDQLSLGEAVTQAKRIYAQTNPDALDVILGWNILGDPTLRL